MQKKRSIIVSCLILFLSGCQNNSKEEVQTSGKVTTSNGQTFDQQGIDSLLILLEGQEKRIGEFKTKDRLSYLTISQYKYTVDSLKDELKVIRKSSSKWTAERKNYESRIASLDKEITNYIGQLKNKQNADSILNSVRVATALQHHKDKHIIDSLLEVINTPKPPVYITVSSQNDSIITAILAQLEAEQKKNKGHPLIELSNISVKSHLKGGLITARKNGNKIMNHQDVEKFIIDFDVLQKETINSPTFNVNIKVIIPSGGTIKSDGDVNSTAGDYTVIKKFETKFHEQSSKDVPVILKAPYRLQGSYLFVFYDDKGIFLTSVKQLLN